jgi:hypothetical protein
MSKVPDGVPSNFRHLESPEGRTSSPLPAPQPGPGPGPQRVVIPDTSPARVDEVTRPRR